MAQAVSHRPLTAQARVCERISLCEICGALGQLFLWFFAVSSFPLWISVFILVYHLVDEQ
jgi:hypothetical protein